jgi:hypothetical protein
VGCSTFLDRAKGYEHSVLRNSRVSSTLLKYRVALSRSASFRLIELDRALEGQSFTHFVIVQVRPQASRSSIASTYPVVLYWLFWIKTVTVRHGSGKNSAVSRGGECRMHRIPDVTRKQGRHFSNCVGCGDGSNLSMLNPVLCAGAVLPIRSAFYRPTDANISSATGNRALTASLDSMTDNRRSHHAARRQGLGPCRYQTNPVQSWD